ARAGAVVVVAAGRRDLLETLLGLVDALLEGERDLAVILERLDRLSWHRVHGARADQVLDVQHVAAIRVLRRRRGPHAPLRRRAPLDQDVPARAGKDLLSVLVGELRVRGGELA